MEWIALLQSVLMIAVLGITYFEILYLPETDNSATKSDKKGVLLTQVAPWDLKILSFGLTYIHLEGVPIWLSRDICI